MNMVGSDLKRKEARKRKEAEKRESPPGSGGQNIHFNEKRNNRGPS